MQVEVNDMVYVEFMVRVDETYETCSKCDKLFDSDDANINAASVVYCSWDCCGPPWHS